MKKQFSRSIGFIALFLVLSPAALAAYIPESTTMELPEMESLAYRGTPTIDGDLSDWKGAVFIDFSDTSDLLRGADKWTGPEDISMRWAILYDEEKLYFAAAVWDDILAEPDDLAQPWMGDTLFLYIDANSDGAMDSKPSSVLVDGVANVRDWNAGGAEMTEVEIAIVMEPELGSAGRIFEVAIPHTSIPNINSQEGAQIRITPGYEEGNSPVAPDEENGVFLDWGGINPDEAAQLGTVKFGGAVAAVNTIGKLATRWGYLKNK